MLILFRPDASATDEQRVVALIQESGCQAVPIPGLRRRAVAVTGNDGRIDGARFSALPGVEEIVSLTKPYRMVAREWRSDPTIIRLPGGITVGGNALLVGTRRAAPRRSARPRTRRTPASTRATT